MKMNNFHEGAETAHGTLLFILYAALRASKYHKYLGQSQEGNSFNHNYIMFECKHPFLTDHIIC